MLKETLLIKIYIYILLHPKVLAAYVVKRLISRPMGNDIHTIYFVDAIQLYQVMVVRVT